MNTVTKGIPKDVQLHIREQAEKVIKLWKTMDATLTSRNSEEHLKLAIIAALIDARHIHYDEGSKSVGVQLIRQERTYQIVDCEHAPECDDVYTDEELAIIAGKLLLHGRSEFPDISADTWGLCNKYKDHKLRRLIIAGALVAAEIDRLKRTTEPESIHKKEKGQYGVEF